MLGTDTSYPKTTRAHNKLSSVWATGQKWSKDGAPLLWPADMRLEKSAWVQEHGDLLWEITCQITSKERRNLPKDNEGLSEQRLPLTGNRHWLGYEGTFWGWWKYKYPVYNFDLHSIFTDGPIYWIGQEIHLGFSYGKTRTKFLANPIKIH